MEDDGAKKLENKSELSLSLTPPILDEKSKEDSEGSISEHISSASIENDRSLQEIEISALEEITPQARNSNNQLTSNTSLTYLEKQNILNTDRDNNVRSILDEILNNEQFNFDQQDSLENSKEESLNIFKNVDLNDHCLFSYDKDEHFHIPDLENEHDIKKRLNDFEELLAVKESTIEALASELEISNGNTGSHSSATEYKQLQEECHHKLMEYNSMIIYKNDLIQKLAESLDQSVTERKELLTQIDGFKEEIQQLQSQLQETTKMVAEHQCHPKIVEENTVDEEINSDVTVESILGDVQKVLGPRHENVGNLKIKLDNLVKRCREDLENNLKLEKEKNNSKKDDYEAEITRLQELLINLKCSSTDAVEIKLELEAKHSKEMEELRTYFEKKCADLEKNYSEEIFSQQSRKMSDSCSESELHSDPVFTHSPGPDGDMKYNLLPNITKKDVTNLKNELNSLSDKISKFNSESMTDEDFANFKTEIAKSNLNILLKWDLSAMKSDLQNKYHAELEVLREDNENKVDVLNLEYEAKLDGLKNKYQEEIDSLRMQLDELQKQHLSISSTVQEVRLAANEVDDEEWPAELLQLRGRFTERYENQIEELKKQHHKEIEKLKEENLKMLNRSLERVKRRSLKDSDSLSKGEIEILCERDNLKKQVSSLRHLLRELLKYFTQCEDELNNTIVEELVKQGFDKSVFQLEEDSPNNSSRSSESFLNITRVHLTPNCDDLLNLIDISCQNDGDISIDLQNELGTCLTKLRQEANAILTLTTNVSKTNAPNVIRSASLEDKVNSLTRQVINESQAKARYKEELDDVNRYVRSLENEREKLENELERMISKGNALEADLMQARNKIAELIENGHKEIVSEGYGEEGPKLDSGDPITMLSELQEKARSLLAESRTSADPSLLNLIEELCRIGEKIKEESKKERQDLLQQIEAADKKYRTTQKFLDEQAIEREQERDEAQKKIDILHLQLRERDKNKMNCEMVATEVNGVCCREYKCTELQVEQLEQQMQEMTRCLEAETERYKVLEIERNEAVEKIKELREIIRELEQQSEIKTNKLEDCIETIQKLDNIIEKQDKSLNRLKQDENGADIYKLYKHIECLEGELQHLRVNAELAGNEGTLNQIKKQLYEMEILLEKRTKELEILHSTETNCSSPSEDISARDLIGAKSPNTMDECEVPLQQLARLKEKLIRHSRAEDAAIKRIKDMDMQIEALKQELEENNGEKDYMKRQLQEQLVLISDLQIRLDEQRIRAEHIEKQTNNSLETRIYNLQNEVVSLQERLQNKEKALHQQQTLLVETQQRLKTIEQDANNDDLIVSMQKDLEKLRRENLELKTKFERETGIVPNIVENIISDKNLDIERLKDKLEDTEKLLEMYTSLNLTKSEIQTLSSLKNSGASLVEAFSILGLSEIDQMRRLDNHTFSRSLSSPAFNVINKDSTLEPEISAIEEPRSLNFIRNSSELSQKRVHFEDTDIEQMKHEVAELEKKLAEKQKMIENYEERLKLLDNLEDKIKHLQSSLDETEKALEKATETFEKEQEDMKETYRNVGIKLAEAKLEISEKDKKIDILEQDSARKDEMCLNLTKEKRELERALEAVKEDNYNTACMANDKEKEINELRENLMRQIQEKDAEIKDKDMNIISLETANEHRQHKFSSLENKYKDLENKYKDVEHKLKAANQQCSKLRELEINLAQVEMATTEMKTLRDKLNKKRRIIKDHESLIEKQKKAINDLEDKIQKLDEVIKSREENMKRFKNYVQELEGEVDELRKSGNGAKNTKVRELESHVAHLTNTINQKENIITKMAEDTHQLHLNLITIKAKLKESGNVVDLANKLKEEQKKNWALLQENHTFKAELMRYKNDPNSKSTEDITDELRRELDNSAQIDSNILSAVSDQSLSSLTETEDVETYKKALHREKTSRQQMVLQINELQADNARLEDVLMKTQTDDAKLIQQLRIELDSLLENKETLETNLKEKKLYCQRLETEIELLKRKNLSSASKTDTTEYRSLPTKEALENVQLKKDLQLVEEEKQKLSNEIMFLNSSKMEIENSLKHTKEMLNLEGLRIKELEEKVQEMGKTEMKLREEIIRITLKNEELVGQIEQATKQKEVLLEEMKAARSEQVPDQLIQNIKELNSALYDNRKLVEKLKVVTDEKNALEQKLLHLERISPEHTDVQNLILRCDFLFAKNLKLDSVRKSLIWQKRYLSDNLLYHRRVCVIQVEPDGRFRNEHRSKVNPKRRFKSYVTVVISIIRMKYLVRRWHSGIRVANKVNSRHFRNLKEKNEVGGAANFQLGQPVSNQHFSRVRTTNPFLQDNVERRDEDGEEARNFHLPWSGHTPPSKDRVDAPLRLGSNMFQRSELTPLRAPELLAQYTERFVQIQEKMGSFDNKV